MRRVPSAVGPVRDARCPQSEMLQLRHEILDEKNESAALERHLLFLEGFLHCPVGVETRYSEERYELEAEILRERTSNARLQVFNDESTGELETAVAESRALCSELCGMSCHSGEIAAECRRLQNQVANNSQELQHRSGELDEVLAMNGSLAQKHAVWTEDACTERAMEGAHRQKLIEVGWDLASLRGTARRHVADLQQTVRGFECDLDRDGSVVETDIAN